MQYLFNVQLIEDVYGIRLSRKKLAELIHVLLCIETVLASSCFGYIYLDPISITTLHIPVLIAAMWLGPLPAVSLSLVFSLSNMWQADFSATAYIDIIFSPVKSGNPLGSIVMNFGSRILFALIAAFVMRYFLRRTPKDKHFTKGTYTGVFFLSAALTFLLVMLLSLSMSFFFHGVIASTLEESGWNIVYENILPYIITGVLSVLAYYLPHNAKVNEIVNRVSDYNREIKSSFNRSMTLLCVALIVAACGVYVNYLAHLIDGFDIEGLDSMLINDLIVAAIQTFIAFSCIIIVVCIITNWISQYHTYSVIKAKGDAAAAAVRAKNIAENASSAKSSFLFNMSHDIRTPMNAISGYTRIAKEHIDDREALSGYLDKIDIANKHLLDLINDILDMGRIESGSVTLNPAPFNVIACANEVSMIVGELAREKNIEFDADINYDPDTWINADRGHLKQIIMNLLSNAIKYTPEGGRISVTLQQIDTGDPKRTGCVYTVTDNGIGMSEEYLKIIFDPYTRSETKKSSGIQGTGLGMYIVKRLVDMMGGSIDITSKLGEGTSVRVAFSFDRAEPAESKVSDETGDNILEGMRVLLVDDNEMNREIAGEILGEYGVNVVEAVDGEDALKKTADSMKNGKPYDLILMDVQMPGMDGFQTTAAIRALPEMADIHVPIIAMTANAFDEDIQKSLDAGMDAHLSKPVDVKNLITTIGEITGK